MKVLIAFAGAALLSISICFAQQSPPADGVGLGNNTSSTSANTSSVPITSPNQNSTVTDATGTVSGNKQPSAYGGAPPANTATKARSQGTGGASESASATAARRESYGRNQSVQKTQPDQNGKTGASTNQTNQQSTPQQ